MTRWGRRSGRPAQYPWHHQSARLSWQHVSRFRPRHPPLRLRKQTTRVTVLPPSITLTLIAPSPTQHIGAPH